MREEQIDIRADLNAQDDDGYGWSTLSRARHPDMVKVGSMDPVFARVASLTERPTGVKVHLEILPGQPLE